MLDMEAIKNFSIDKADWQKVKFGDVVFEPKESVRDPVAEGIEHVVGLEHINSEDMHLRRAASIEESTTFTKKFSKGDVLFGRRRAYLKKAAKASFGGICSGDITVMRAKEKLLSPELLPFLVNNDNFFEFAITHSAGGLSPRVKFKDLAEYELILPPLEMQSSILKLLLSVGSLIEQELKVLSGVKYQSKVYLAKSFRYGAFLNQVTKESEYGDIPANWELKRLNELGEFKNGVNKGKDQFGFGKPFVNLLDVFGINELSNKDFDLVNASKSDIENYDLRKGDVLFIRSSVKPSGVGLTALIKENLFETVFSGFIIRFRPFNSDLSDTFKKYCFYEDRFRYSLTRRSTISANTNINQESLNRLLVPVPPLEEQQEFGRRMLELELLKIEVENKIKNSRKLLKNIIKQVF